MKLRCTPEDFRVTEQSRLIPRGGAFALYRLTKTSLGTPEAIQAIVERWNVHRKRISYGGLKDRHAVTIQYLTIHQGPTRNLNQKNLELHYLGQTNEAFTSAHFEGNQFELVLRDMADDEVQRAERALEVVRNAGLPNYFDDQRFGSLGESGEWIARAWCLGQWERALWLALADPHRYDSSSEKKQKALLRDLWGRWPECQQKLDRSHRRSIVTYLSDKVKAGRDPDYRGAIARIHLDLRGLYLSAYQSALWNRILNRWLHTVCRAEHLSEYRLLSGPAAFPLQVTSEQINHLSTVQLPLPSARIDEPEGELGMLYADVLAEEQIELRQLRVKYPRDSFFSKGQRAALIRVSDLNGTASDDELYAGRRKLTVSFSLPRGSYATILVKRITEFQEADDDGEMEYRIE